MTLNLPDGTRLPPLSLCRAYRSLPPISDDPSALARQTMTVPVESWLNKPNREKNDRPQY